jgi:hypothetical protein
MTPKKDLFYYVAYLSYATIQMNRPHVRVSRRKANITVRAS